MRPSFLLLIFFILLNGWGGLLHHYHIDDHLGINTETGHNQALQNAQTNATSIRTGNSIGQTLLGYYNALMGGVKKVFLGLNPGVQMLANIVPKGIAQSLVLWAFGFLEIVMAADFYAYARGVDL